MTIADDLGILVVYGLAVVLILGLAYLFRLR